MKEEPLAFYKYEIMKRFSYLVTLDGEEYYTKASTSKSAVSNAAFRHSVELNESVALVKWKINQGQIECEVEEI